MAGWRGFIPAEARVSPGLLAAGAGVRPLYGGETGGSPVTSVGGSHQPGQLAIRHGQDGSVDLRLDCIWGDRCFV